MTSAITTLQTYLTKVVQCGVCNKHVDDVTITHSTAYLTIEVRFRCHGDLELLTFDTYFLSSKSVNEAIDVFSKMIPPKVFLTPAHNLKSCKCATCLSVSAMDETFGAGYMASTNVKFGPGLGIINDSLDNYYNIQKQAAPPILQYSGDTPPMTITSINQIDGTITVGQNKTLTLINAPMLQLQLGDQLVITSTKPLPEPPTKKRHLTRFEMILQKEETR